MNYNDLEVYKRASSLFPKIYRMVRSWKEIDQREIGSQIIRAANSIHANIAEGANKSKNELRRYLTNSIGSCDEIISHLNDAFNVGLIDKLMKEDLHDSYTIVGKQLTNLKKSLTDN